MTCTFCKNERFHWIQKWRPVTIVKEWIVYFTVYPYLIIIYIRKAIFLFMKRSFFFISIFEEFCLSTHFLLWHLRIKKSFSVIRENYILQNYKVNLYNFYEKKTFYYCASNTSFLTYLSFGYIFHSIKTNIDKGEKKLPVGNSYLGRMTSYLFYVKYNRDSMNWKLSYALSHHSIEIFEYVIDSFTVSHFVGERW